MSEQQSVPAAALEQARAEMSNGNSAAAVTLVRQVVGRPDTTPDQLAAAARLGVNLGLEESFGWTMRAGRRQMEAGSLEDARETFTAARALDEKNYEPIFELGRVEIAAGNKAEGLGRFAEVLRKSNYTFVPALFEAGCVYEADDQVDQAILTFKRIVERDKSHAYALDHLGKLYKSKQMAPEATAYFLQSAEAARKIMDYALALRCARDIIEFDPGNARALGLEAEMLRILPEPRAKEKASAEPAPAPAPKPAPPPPPVQQVAAGVVPHDFRLIEQQSKATLELAQVTAGVAEAYKQRLAIEEQIKAAQATLESVTAAGQGADQELTAIKAQLYTVGQARVAEEAAMAALSAKLDQARQGLVALETLHESIKQADEQRQGILKTIEQLKTEAAAVQTAAGKAKTDASSVEKALTEVTGGFGALRKEAETAKAVLDDAKTQAEKAKADAAAAEAAVVKAREKFEASRTAVDAAEQRIIEAAAHANAVGSDAAVTIAGIADVETSVGAALAAQKTIEDAIGQLRALAVALTERRKQTEAALTQIAGIGETQATGLNEADIAKLEAGLAAAIEKAAVAAHKPPQPAAPAAPAAATPAPPPVAAAAAKPNGVSQAPAPPPAPAKAKADAGKPPEKAAEKPADKAVVPERSSGSPKADDNSPGGVFARGSAALEAKKPQEALKIFEALASNPEFAVLAQTAIGRCYAQMGQFDEAIARYSKALETPGHPEEQYHEALYYMSAAHESRDDAESRELAVWALEEIVAANPRYRDVAARMEALKSKAGKAAAGGAA